MRQNPNNQNCSSGLLLHKLDENQQKNDSMSQHNLYYQLQQDRMSRFTKMLSDQFRYNAIFNPLQNQTCEQMHNGSCNMKALSQFAEACKSIYKMYLLVHLVPLFVFKRKKLKENPARELKKVLLAFVKSMLFAGGYSCLIRRVVCFVTTFYRNSGKSSVISGMVASPCLVFEPISRQAEIALYTLNKSMEVLYNLALRRSWPVKIPYGQCWLNGVAMAIICFTYLNDRDVWRVSYRSALDKFLGDV